MSQSKPNIIHELKVNRLPSLPNVLVEMLRACENNQASFQELSQIISRDTVIAGRVISLANSSFYNTGTKITTLERALFLLGTDTLKTIVITASIQQFFSSFKSTHSDFLLAFWKRSLSCALLAKALAILTSYPNPDEVYLTGLLHNIGELVLDSNRPDFYSDHTNISSTFLSDSEQLALEKKYFSFTHAQVGACLAKEWGLSQFTCDAIEFHHADKDLIEDAHHLVKLIYLASFLSHPQKQHLEAHDEIAHQLFELNSALVNEIVIKIESEVCEVSRSLGLALNKDSNKQAIKESQEQAQLNLAKQVRNISLIQNAMGELNRANNKTELENSLKNALNWLYGFDNSAIFWYCENSHQLMFEHPDNSNSLPIKFKLETQRSLLAKSALSQYIISSIDEATTLTVVDAQLINLLQTDGFLCVPIQDREGLICVLAVGINNSVNEPSHFSQFLSFFAHEAASVCRRSLKNLLNEESAKNEIYQLEYNDQLHLHVDEVIHEANNPLNIISNYLYSLGQRLGNKETFSSEDISKELNIVREEVHRTSQILLQLKDLKQDVAFAHSGVDMNAEIQDLCTIYKNSLFLIKQIQCDLHLDPKLQSLSLNRNSLKQILTNLIRNASEALPEAGKGNIKISTNALINVNGHDFVGLCIEDNGPGIPADILKELFKPVVSTKGNGHSGLGLSITKNLVKDAKGTISCRSSENGTVFQILFPKEPCK
jgi:HD-like signal output (HDOD) protein/signal transduction histidine kinase